VVDRRLSRAERRLQLLDTAAALVRTEGADALTLARVAEEAGVTKPVVYGHFDTRVGLLTALYEQVDQQQTAATSAALEARAHNLTEAASMLAEAYLDCVLHIGKEFGGITAALLANAELTGLLEAGRRRYAISFLEAVERFTNHPIADGQTVMLAVVGAAETLAREVIAGQLGRDTALDVLTRLIVASAA
jgi:AcrR family transcriptional regulator